MSLPATDTQVPIMARPPAPGAARHPMTAAAAEIVAASPADLPAALSDDDEDDGRMVGASLALALMRRMAEAAYVMDCDGRVTFINPAGLVPLVRHKRGGEAVGSYLWDLWPAADRGLLHDAISDAAAGDATELGGVPCPGHDLPGGACKVSMAPIEDASGRVTKIVALVHPI